MRTLMDSMLCVSLFSSSFTLGGAPGACVVMVRGVVTDRSCCVVSAMRRSTAAVCHSLVRSYSRFMVSAILITRGPYAHFVLVLFCRFPLFYVSLLPLSLSSQSTLQCVNTLAGFLYPLCTFRCGIIFFFSCWASVSRIRNCCFRFVNNVYHRTVSI